ncbi:MAG: molecular chaperone TorD, partial [Eggerthella sp.]|nr:molecular chaperone TorD [Eggerthella sp.]
MGNEVADASVWQARAAAWELAALSLRYPGAELAEAAAGGEWDEAAGEILAALGLPAEVPAAAGEGGCEAAAGADALLHALR